MSINKPIEAWVREDDTLYIGFPEGKPPFAGIQAAARASEALDEFGHDIRPSYVEIREHKDVVYVHPDAYAMEHWDEENISLEEQRVDWVEVWRVPIYDIYRSRDGE